MPAAGSAPERPHYAPASAATTAWLRPREDAGERGIVGLGLVEQLEELPRRRADVFPEPVRVEQPRDPSQADVAVDRWRRVDPAEGKPRSEIHPLGGDRGDRGPQGIGAIRGEEIGIP